MCACGDSAAYFIRVPIYLIENSKDNKLSTNDSQLSAHLLIICQLYNMGPATAVFSTQLIFYHTNIF